MSAIEPHTQITDDRTVGIPVTDQDRALAFYRDTLGFETRMDGTFGEGLRWIEVGRPARPPPSPSCRRARTSGPVLTRTCA